ncbi:MAG TPA: ABC transporter permease subunit [Gemmatimonadaceae bacterium]|nr:ABC transporter permease subunit [Gemmatimonadaceae bacterium]
MADERAAGTIYDIGYQHYDGPRRGRGYAFRTLFAFSFRTAFGQGRGQRAHLVPFLVSLLVVLPAIIPIGIASVSGQTAAINYAQHLEFSAFFLALFTAGQSGELIVADRETGTLSLYLSRSLHSTDYALAKLVALAAAILALTLVPQLMMFTGKVFLSETPWTAFQGEWKKLIPMVGGTLLASFYLAAVGLALAATSRRRNYASAMVIAYFVVLPALSGIATEIARGDAKRYMVLLNPFLLMTGFANWLYDVQARRGMLRRADLPGELYLYVIAGTCALAIAGLLWRYWKAEE